MRDGRELKTLLAELVKGSPFEGKTFFVGGCVRDELLGEPVKDYDLVVEELGGAKKLAWFLHARFPKEISRPHELGAGYPIWQVVFKHDIDTSGGLVLVQGWHLEIADTQKESYPDACSRARVSVYGPLSEDCERRDFTCNMLYQEVVTQKILDPSGKGLDDIKARLLRTHPKVDARKIFSDDPLRMLRMVRFQTRFGWGVDAVALQATEECKPRLRILSAERVRDEWIKMIEKGKFAAALRIFQQLGFIEILWPEMLPMIGCEQDKLYHSEGDVWTHTLMVIEQAPKTQLLQLAALLHDIGKPATQTRVGDRIKFILHEDISAKIALELMKKWKFPVSLTKEVVRLIDLHLRGGDVSQWKSLRPARKLLRDAGGLLEPLLELIEADSRSSKDPQGRIRVEHIAELRKKLSAAQVTPVHIAPLLSGHDIMKELGIKPGAHIKVVQKALEEFEDALADSGETLTRERALQWLRQNFDSKTPLASG